MTRSRALIAGWLVVGFLDILDAFLFFGLRYDVHPSRILHSIAAGVVGRDSAIGGGGMTASIGLALHIFGVGIPAVWFAREAATHKRL